MALHLRFHLSAALFLISALIIPSSIFAQQPNAGCHLATDAEKAAMVARGIPASFQVCPADMKILGIGQDFEVWYAQLKTQSPCNRNTCTLSCRTRNTGAQVCGPTATRWNAIGCHPNNRTAIFPTASHGFAAHIELLRRYCGERGRCTIGRVVEQWTATVGDRPAYASFVSKNSGMPINQVYDPNDIDLVGRIALSMSCFEAGAMPYDVAELKRGLIMAGGGARVPVPPNVGELLNESLTGSYAENPAGSLNSHPGSWAYSSPTLSGNNYTPPTPPANPLPIINEQSGTNQSTGTNSTESNASQLLAATLVAQPAIAKPGGIVLVSWSTVGAEGYRCVVKQGELEVGQGVNDSKRDRISLTRPPGMLAYQLTCEAPGAAPVVREAEVTISP